MKAAISARESIQPIKIKSKGLWEGYIAATLVRSPTTRTQQESLAPMVLETNVPPMGCIMKPFELFLWVRILFGVSFVFFG